MLARDTFSTFCVRPLLQILSQRIESAKTLMRPRYNSVNRTNVDDTLAESADAGEEEC